MSWQATVLTIFPEMLPGPLAHSLAGKALAAGIWRLETVDMRDFAGDKHRSVDDAPFGGGPGMVLRPDVLDAAIDGAGGVGPLIHLSPRGRGGEPRRFCLVGRRAGGDRADRRLRAVAAGGRGLRRDAGGGEFCRGAARILALYAPAALAGPGGAGGAGVGRSRAHPRLAAGRGGASVPGTPPGSLAALFRAPRGGR